MWITKHTYLRYFLDSLVAQAIKSQPAMQETWVWSLGWEDSPGEGNGNPFQYSCLENPMDGGAWQAIVHGVAKSQTWLSDFTFTFLSCLYSIQFPLNGNTSQIIVQYHGEGTAIKDRSSLHSHKDISSLHFIATSTSLTHLHPLLKPCCCH